MPDVINLLGLPPGHYAAGCRAYAEGRDETDCPEPHNTLTRETWLQGFRDAAKDQRYQTTRRESRLWRKTTIIKLWRPVNGEVSNDMATTIRSFFENGNAWCH